MASLTSLISNLKIEESEFGEIEIGNEGLTKRVLTKGLSWQIPSHGDQVEGTYVREYRIIE